MGEIVAAYADGGVIRKNPSSIGGTWAFCLIGQDGQIVKQGSGVVPVGTYGLTEITNNVTEMMALLKCLWALPKGWSGPVYSDSAITIGRVFHGWKMDGIPEHLANHALPTVKQHVGKIEPVLLDGHPTKAQLAAGIGKRGNPCSPWNVWCDKECGRLAIEHLAEIARSEVKTKELVPA